MDITSYIHFDFAFGKGTTFAFMPERPGNLVNTLVECYYEDRLEVAEQLYAQMIWGQI